MKISRSIFLKADESHIGRYMGEKALGKLGRKIHLYPQKSTMEMVLVEKLSATFT